MYKINKRGLSPAIATVLLISLALILAALIFIWASSLLKERNQKFGEPIENACSDIVFVAEIYGNCELHVANKGKVPIQGFEIKKKTEGSIESLGIAGSETTIGEGETKTFDLRDFNRANSLGEGDVLITPIIYGLQKGQRTPYVCDGAEINTKAEGCTNFAAI